MDRHDAETGPELLAAYQPALRSLARKLVRDAGTQDDADDLVQATFVRAIERRPDPGRSLFAWLRTVLVNESRLRARAERRRLVRETQVAAHDAVAATSASEVSARFDAAALLFDAVRRLDPLHRDVVLLRFFDDLPPRKIAARLGVPVKTIDSRLQRALARLRLELDAGHRGDRAAWLAAIFPLAKPPAAVLALAPLTSLLGVLTVKAFVIASGLLIGIVATSLWATHDGPAVEERQVADRAAKPDLAPPVIDPNGEPSLDRAHAEVTGADRPNSSEAASNAATLVRRSGRFVDLDGKPLVGARLATTPYDQTSNRAESTTGKDGSFTFEVTPGSYGVESRADEFLILADRVFEVPADPASDELIVIGAEAVELRGIVTCDDIPLAGADVEISSGDEVRIRLGADSAYWRNARDLMTTDSLGRFVFESVPRIEGLVVAVSKPGYERIDFKLEGRPGPELRFALARLDTAPATLEGVVFGRDGKPFQGAFLGFGGRPARSDAAGRFTFDYDAAASPERLLACAKGTLPVTLVRPATGSWPSFVEVRFAADPLVIAGEVLDENGDLLAHATISIDGSTPLAAWDQGIWVAEQIVRGDQALRTSTRSDAQGRFRLDGLLEREYKVTVLDAHRAWIHDAGSIRAGAENVVIRLSRDELVPRLAGRVIDHSGAGVANADVYVEARMLAATSAEGLKYFDTASGPSVQTDEFGNFVLTDVPTRDAVLQVTCEGLLDDAQVALTKVDASRPLEIVVSWRCDFRAEFAAAANVVGLELHDAAGAALKLFRYEAGAISNVIRAPVRDGASEVLAVSDAAAWLVLVRRDANGVESTERKPVRLVRGEINVLR
jgi:RNA polymerase sigma factor (sigma-70 family)